MWTKGQSGNPKGRPKAHDDISALARTYGVDAIRTLVHCLRDPRFKVAAATELLNRGYGRPPQMITGDAEKPVAIEFSWQQAQAAPGQSNAKTIDGVANRLELVWCQPDDDEPNKSTG